MANYCQLSTLTAQARLDFAAGLGRVHCHLTVVKWPSPDAETVYSFSNHLADPRYVTPLTTWLAGRELIPTFATQEGSTALFHDITKTSGFNDDTVTLNFSNDSREIERLINYHNAGAQVEIWDFYPEVDGGSAYCRFIGTLQTPTSHGDITQGFVRLTAVSGLASSDILIPHLAHSQNCEVRFPPGPGAAMSIDQRKSHPCTYNRDLDGDPNQATLGGAKGLLDASGNAFTTCPHTKAGCIQRFGHDNVFMGIVQVTQTQPVGAGEHKTYSTTHGRATSLEEPASIVAGTRNVSGVLLDWRNEVNPSASNRDAGTKVTMWEFSLGPVESMTDFKLMEVAPQGTDYRLGTDEQTPTVFILDPTNSPNYNRRAVANLNANPVDPSKIQVEQLKASCQMQGYNRVRIYTDATTYSEAFTNNRAWWALMLLTEGWFGLGWDHARVYMADFINLASKNVSFNCQVTARSAQQQFSDIFMPARWYPPFYDNHGIWRFIPIEELDLVAGDIATFTDAGINANIILTNEGLSTLSPLPLNRLKMPNDIFVILEDENYENAARPLHFPDWTAQRERGVVYGDYSTTKIKATYSAYGLTSTTEAIPFGAFVRDLGPFGQGGLQNPCEITFTTKPAHHAEAQELHLNRAVFADSLNLDPTIYLDPQGNAYQAWIVTRLHYTSEDDLEVTCIAYGKSFYDSECSPQEGYVHWPTPDVNVVAGDHGDDTRLQNNTGGAVSVVSTTWPGTITPSDIYVDRWSYVVTSLPTSGVWNITHPSGPLGYKLWPDGSAWLYYDGYVDFGVLIPAGTIRVGSSIGIEYDKNGGSPVRYYKVNGVTVHTDTVSVMPLNDIAAEVDSALGNIIQEIYWQVFPCSPTDEQEGGSAGGGTVVMPTVGEGAEWGDAEWGDEEFG